MPMHTELIFTVGPVLLQKPSRISKSRDHIECLERCLMVKSWKDGDIQTLLHEGKTIQRRLQTFHNTNPSTKNSSVVRSFTSEVARRIVAKAVLTVLCTDIQKAASSLQLCAGLISGVEAAVHAIHDSFNSESCQTALLIDATNALNCLNREAALHNIRHLCPSFSTISINTYRSPTELFVDGSTILSQEGTTQ